MVWSLSFRLSLIPSEVEPYFLCLLAIYIYSKECFQCKPSLGSCILNIAEQIWWMGKEDTAVDEFVDSSISVTSSPSDPIN